MKAIFFERVNDTFILHSHKPEEWSLSQFLLLYRDKILKTPPFHDVWHALDGAWTRRFIRAVQERNEKIDVKTKVNSESNRLYWREIIRDRMKIETTLVTDTEGLHTLQTSVQFHGENIRNNYDNCEKANKEYQNLSSNDDHDESDEIDKFFTSPSETKLPNLFSQKMDNSTKKRRKLSSERSIANEADDEKDKVDEAHGSPTSDEDDNADYIPIPEEEYSDYMSSNDEDQNPPPLLTLSQFKCFNESYAKMKKTQKWILSTGTCVEDAIFEHCNKLSGESLLHSWIVDLDDQETEALFTVTEWKEIRREIRRLPKVDETFVELLMRFANVKTTSELRHILETTSYRNMDEPYDREKHYDAKWVDIVMRKYLTNYEDSNGILHKSHLESWHDINVWSLIIDHGLRNLIGIETVRKESTSGAVSVRRNQKRICTRHKNIERKMMGSRMDGIFRTYVNDIEYGAIEVAKAFDEIKLLTDGYKLSKIMYDMLIYLSKQVNFEETKVRKLRVVGMLHLGLKTQVLHLSSPKGYVMLTSVWILKKAIIDCVDTVNSQVQNSIDLRQELVAMGTETSPPSIVLPWS
ncbi:5796_t:CDS:10, partial [Ambispora gerdemannii]